MKNCVGILFVCYDATDLRIVNENQVWEKIIHDRDCKLHECSILKVIFVNRNRFIILKFLEVAIEKYKKRELIVLPEP